jgi:hypothetical protein
VALPLSSYPYSPECLEEKFSEVHSVGASRIAVIIGREWWQGDLRRRDPRLHLDLAGALLHGQARVGDLRGAVDPDHPQPGTDPPGGRLRLLTLTQTLTPKPPTENRSSTRLASAVRVTLSTTLTTIQNRRPLAGAAPAPSSATEHDNAGLIVWTVDRTVAPARTVGVVHGSSIALAHQVTSGTYPRRRAAKRRTPSVFWIIHRSARKVNSPKSVGAILNRPSS